MKLDRKYLREMRDSRSRKKGWELGMKTAASIAEKYAASCLATEPRDCSTHDMGLGAQRAATEIRRAMQQ